MLLYLCCSVEGCVCVGGGGAVLCYGHGVGVILHPPLCESGQYNIMFRHTLQNVTHIQTINFDI